MNYIFELWNEQFERYMPHIHCYVNDWNLAAQNITNDIFTFIQYLVIACFFYKLSKWGVKNGNWNKLNNALMYVFIFCGLNYLMMAVVIQWEIYYLQLAIKYIGNIMFLKAIFHLFHIGATPLGLFMNALKRTVHEEGF